MDWRRLVQLKFFAEDHDIGEGPPWAHVLMAVSSTLGSLCGLIAILSMLRGHNPGIAGGVFVAGFAISSGASWHLQMRGRALNGLLLSVLGTLLLLLFSTP